METFNFVIRKNVGGKIQNTIINCCENKTDIVDQISMLDFLKTILSFLAGNQIEYMLSGSMALSVYVLPRATRDFDFIVQLRHHDASLFVQHFREGYYCDEETISDAVKNHGMFNIIDHASGFKADFVILKDEVFRKTEFQRRKEIDFLGTTVFIASAEDLLISKLIWIQDFYSNLQAEDIRQLVALKSLDRDYIKNWIEFLSLKTFDLL